ncbi:MAG: hypothetical protein ABI862_12075 [Ilumatobacteraceae bacterium]
MNVLTLTGHLVTGPGRRHPLVVCEFRPANNPVVVQYPGGS